MFIFSFPTTKQKFLQIEGLVLSFARGFFISPNTSRGGREGGNISAPSAPRLSVSLEVNWQELLTKNMFKELSCKGKEFVFDEGGKTGALNRRRETWKQGRKRARNSSRIDAPWSSESQQFELALQLTSELCSVL